MLRSDLPFHPGAEVFNIGTGIARTDLDIIELVERITSVRLDVEFAPRRPFDQQSAVLNIESARTVLGWNPSTSLESVVNDMLLAIPSVAPDLGGRLATIKV